MNLIKDELLYEDFDIAKLPEMRKRAEQYMLESRYSEAAEIWRKILYGCNNEDWKSQEFPFPHFEEAMHAAGRWDECDAIMYSQGEHELRHSEETRSFYSIMKKSKDQERQHA